MAEKASMLPLEEAHRLQDDPVVEPVAQVHDRALPDPAHQVGAEVGEHPLGEVEEDDEPCDPAEVHVLDEYVVEDGLDEVREPRRGDAETEHRRAGEREPATVLSLIHI